MEPMPARRRYRPRPDLSSSRRQAHTERTLITRERHVVIIRGAETTIVVQIRHQMS
jgi:hypothetical protein